MLSIINSIYPIHLCIYTLKQSRIKQSQIISIVMHYAFIFNTSIFCCIIMGNTLNKICNILR